jgi:hypothetical protein
VEAYFCFDFFGSFCVKTKTNKRKNDGSVQMEEGSGEMEDAFVIQTTAGRKNLLCRKTEDR